MVMMLKQPRVERAHERPARSRKEAVAHVVLSRCRACNGPEILLSQEQSDDHSIAIALRTYCADCEIRWVHAYPVGPGWEQQPETDDFPIFANTQSPSELLPQSFFLQECQDAVAHLLNRAKRDDDADFLDAKCALESLGELEKMARAAGQDLDTALTERRPWLQQLFTAAGGELAPE